MSPDIRPDALFGGKLKLAQAARGHRVGTDAVLLTAAAGAAERVADFGAGVGAVGLGLLALGRARSALLVEMDASAAALARANVADNGLENRAQVIEADITGLPALLSAAGLRAQSVDLVVSNPPYNDPRRHRTSPDAARAAAHAMDTGGMERWLKAAARCLTGDGRLVMIHRPEALPWLLPGLAIRFGAITVLPVYPQAQAAASRVLIGARLNTKAPARVLPGLVLHGEDGAFTSEVAALHAGERGLAL